MFNTLFLLLATLLPNCFAVSVRFTPSDIRVSASPLNKRSLSMAWHPTGEGTDPISKRDSLSYTEIDPLYEFLLEDCNNLLAYHKTSRGWFTLSDWSADHPDRVFPIWWNGTCAIGVNRHDGYTDNVEEVMRVPPPIPSLRLSSFCYDLELIWDMSLVSETRICAPSSRTVLPTFGNTALGFPP
ncbi:unnamed protein product [Discula destructiva]